mmetsp:Transcript_11120/g.23194  ORF Transcript_11120/g.23194 Transcript_11120/m.23194 type:complete len:347 (+) Transcript_11120:531-1571(+)
MHIHLRHHGVLLVAARVEVRGHLRRVQPPHLPALDLRVEDGDGVVVQRGAGAGPPDPQVRLVWHGRRLQPLVEGLHVIQHPGRPQDLQRPVVAGEVQVVRPLVARHLVEELAKAHGGAQEVLADLVVRGGHAPGLHAHLQVPVALLQVRQRPPLKGGPPVGEVGQDERPRHLEEVRQLVRRDGRAALHARGELAAVRARVVRPPGGAEVLVRHGHRLRLRVRRAHQRPVPLHVQRGEGGPIRVVALVGRLHLKWKVLHGRQVVDLLEKTEQEDSRYASDHEEEDSVCKLRLLFVGSIGLHFHKSIRHGVNMHSTIQTGCSLLLRSPHALHGLLPRRKGYSSPPGAC